MTAFGYVPILFAVSPFAAIRSAPTRTRSTSPLWRRRPAAASTTIAWSIPAFPSSHAVSREPWRYGRVSEAYTKNSRPASFAAVSGAITVPTSTVARAPALQCVRIRIPSLMSRFPWRPIARHRSMSARAYSSAASRAVFPSSTSCSTRSIAANRSWPVGLVFLRRTAARLRSIPWISARASPYAAAAPIAGAPRIAIPSIARAMSSRSLSSRIFTEWGRARWSIIRTVSPSSQTVRRSRGGRASTARRPASPAAAEGRQQGTQLRGPDRALHVALEVLVVRDLALHLGELALQAGFLLVEVPDRVEELLLAEAPPLGLLLRGLESVRHRNHRSDSGPWGRAPAPPPARNLREARRAPN